MDLSTALLALAMVFAAGTLAADERSRVRERSGDKQGPLLLGDDMVEALSDFVGDAEATGETPPAVDADAPAEDAWRLPPPPDTQADETWVFVPPMPRGCRNAADGTGAASVEAGEHRGQFELDLRAGPGEYAWSVASPCLTFTPERDGMVRCRAAVVVHGTVETAGALDDTAAYLGAWIAHCHPKERGNYSERVGWDSAGMTGTVRFDGYVLMHESTFAVQGDVEHLFGAGLSAACAARDGGAGMALAGRLAHLTVEMLD
jgi:hypothetical protein